MTGVWVRGCASHMMKDICIFQNYFCPVRVVYRFSVLGPLSRRRLDVSEARWLRTVLGKPRSQGRLRTLHVEWVDAGWFFMTSSAGLGGLTVPRRCGLTWKIQDGGDGEGLQCWRQSPSPFQFWDPTPVLLQAPFAWCPGNSHGEYCEILKFAFQCRWSLSIQCGLSHCPWRQKQAPYHASKGRVIWLLPASSYTMFLPAD